LTLLVTTVGSAAQAATAAAKKVLGSLTFKLALKGGWKLTVKYTVTSVMKGAGKEAVVEVTRKSLGKALKNLVKKKAFKEAFSQAYKAELKKRGTWLLIGASAGIATQVKDAASKLAQKKNLDKSVAANMEGIAENQTLWRIYSKAITDTKQERKHRLALAAMLREVRSTPMCIGTWNSNKWLKDPWGAIVLEQDGTKVTGLFGWIPNHPRETKGPLKGYQIHDWFVGRGPAKDLKVGQIEGSIDAQGNVSLKWWKGVTRDKKYEDAAKTDRGVLKLTLQSDGTLKGYWLLEGQADNESNQKENAVQFNRLFK